MACKNERFLFTTPDIIRYYIRPRERERERGSEEREGVKKRRGRYVIYVGIDPRNAISPSIRGKFAT